MRAARILLGVAALGLFSVPPAQASFHLMQIEQVIGGVNGDVTAQAIQLRMRSSFQNQVQQGRLIAADATGSNPIVVLDVGAPVSNFTAGTRVLICTSAMLSYVPGLTPDFTMTNPIPPSYLAAGTLTWEQDPPAVPPASVMWRLSWGGASYTGTGTGSTNNDADGNFSPPFAGPLPSTTDKALQFQFSFSAASTNNANDYALTSGAATLTNSRDSSALITKPASVGPGGLASAIALGPPTPNPVTGVLSYDVTLPSTARVQVRIFDVRGRLVLKVIDQTMSAGRHPLTWQVARGALRNGTYYLVLDASGTKRSRKFTFIR
jgi:hypothetical protein